MKLVHDIAGGESPCAGGHAVFRFVAIEPLRCCSLGNKKDETVPPLTAPYYTPDYECKADGA